MHKYSCLDQDFLGWLRCRATPIGPQKGQAGLNCQIELNVNLTLYKSSGNVIWYYNNFMYDLTIYQNNEASQ